jgi:HEAT repeat protein
VRIGTDEATRALLRRARFPEVREAFAEAGPRVEALLVDRLAKENASGRILVVELLGLCGGPCAVDALVPLARDPALAPHVLDALGSIAGDEAIRALARLASVPRHRRGAIEALGATAAEAAVPALVGIGRTDRSCRRDSIRALARIPSARAVEGILALVPGSRAEKSALRALQGMDPDLVLPALTAMLGSELETVARGALLALGAPAAGHESRRPSIY